MAAGTRSVEQQREDIENAVKNAVAGAVTTALEAQLETLNTAVAEALGVLKEAQALEVAELRLAVKRLESAAGDAAMTEASKEKEQDEDEDEEDEDEDDQESDNSSDHGMPSKKGARLASTEDEETDADKELRRALKLFKPATPLKYSALPGQTDVLYRRDWQQMVRSNLKLVALKNPANAVSWAAEVCLGGDPYYWFKLLEGSAIPKTLDDFFAALFSKFVHTDDQRDAMNNFQILRLLPSETVTQFEARLRRVGAAAGATDQMIIEQFRRVMPKALAFAISQAEAQQADLNLDYQGFFKMAARLEAANRQLGGGGNQGASSRQLNYMNQAGPRRARRTGEWQPPLHEKLRIPKAVLDERFANNVCLKCGKPGHRWILCTEQSPNEEAQ